MGKINQSAEINRRTWLALASAGLLTACSRADSPAREMSKTPPNIIMIMVDDLNDWVGAMNGHPQAKTPNIDSLAAGGTIFANAHAQAPICGPSRTSLMTGLLPSTTGVYGHINDADIRSASPALHDIVFLPEHLAEAGYHTMGIGTLFHQGAPENTFHEFGGRHPGFGPKPEKSFHWDQPATSTDWGAYPEREEDMPDLASANWAAQRLRRSYDTPFFLSAGFLRPHVPWYVPQHWFDIYDKDSLWLPPYLDHDWDDIPERAGDITNLPNMPHMQWVKDNAQWQNIVHAYLASVSFVDHCTGIILSALKDSPHSDNTVVLFCSDHGYHLGEKGLFQKFTLWQRSTRVPLILSGPNIPADKVISDPAGLIDIYPTLAALAGSTIPDTAQGRSLLPLLKSGGADDMHAIVTTYGRGNHAVRDRRYTLIQYADGSQELYDRQQDPNEWDNLVDSPDHQSVIKRLGAHLPPQDAAWSPKSEMEISPYFRQAKNRQ